MALLRYGRVFLLLISFTFVTQIAYNYYNEKKKRPKNKARKEINEVIMFSQDGTVLKKSKHSRCSITTSMDRILHYLNSPRQTMDVCMYVLTNIDLTNAILKLHYRGIKLRFIIDADMAFASGSLVRRLEKQGIPVRWMKSSNLMHHKFCLIDASAQDNQEVTPIVLMGSLNWTNQALSGNWEDVTVTSQRDLVHQYKQEFEKLWVQFKPIVNV